MSTLANTGELVSAQLLEDGALVAALEIVSLTVDDVVVVRDRLVLGQEGSQKEATWQGHGINLTVAEITPALTMAMTRYIAAVQAHRRRNFTLVISGTYPETAQTVTTTYFDLEFNNPQRAVQRATDTMVTLNATTGKPATVRLS